MPETPDIAAAADVDPIEVPAEVIADDPPLEGDHIIGMSFDKPSRAEEVLLNLSHLAAEHEIGLVDAVIVGKDERGKVHIRQTIDVSPGRGAMSGTMWGGLVGAIFGGPVGLAVGAAVGAGAGGLAGKLVDVGLDDDWIKQVGEWLDPGTTALLVLVSSQLRGVVLRELGRFEGQVLYCTFPDEVRHELERALSQNR